MPKTLKNVWDTITSFSNLVAAWEYTRKGKRFSHATLRFGASLEENLFDIQGKLLHRTWLPGKWREFIAREPKLRLIQAPSFEDRVVHHALVRVISPAFERRFIADSYACRKGRGTLSAGNRLTEFLRRAAHSTRSCENVYVLKADIKSYFPSINHNILLHIIGRTVGDRDAMWLIERIVRENGFEGCGLPIGALTSQLFANAYLDVIDHYIKDELGVRWYVRYMDDFIIVDTDKFRLRDILTRVDVMLWERLRLTLNPKTSIFPASHGVDFAGYRHWTAHRLPRKRNIRRARRKFRIMRKLYRTGEIDISYVRARVMSFLGYAKHCNAKKTTESALGDLVLTRGQS